MQNKKRKILIVDDSELNRALLSDILQDTYDILEADNGAEAMAVLHERSAEISLMLLDIVMPGMDGFEVLAMMNKQGFIHNIPVVMISSENSGTYIDRAYDLGAIDYISRPFDERTVRHRVTCNYMLSLKQNEMQTLLSEQIYQKEKDNNLMVEILSNIVEFRNGESGLHVLHVHAITEQLLQQLVKKTSEYGLTQADIRMIGLASALHDIGKIAVPSEILNKPGKLTDDEYAVMKTHTVEGARILENLPLRKNEELVKLGYQICRWHHERYDGNGYPDRLKGDQIPIAAQVVALADVYDALVSPRVYKKAYSPEKAMEMICNGECGAFNPLLIECLKELAPVLQHELEVISYGHATERDLSESVGELLGTAGNGVSDRLIKQIEHERMKYKHLADISREITFEYVVSPQMIKLSDWSAESLHLPASIVNPAENADWCRIFPKEDFVQLLSDIHATTPQNEVVSRRFLSEHGGEKKWNRVIAKALWTDEPSELEGAVCKIIDINDTEVTLHKLQRRAEHDALTGLLNRAAAKRRIQTLLDTGEGKHYALLFFDIDDFKQANDTYGHLFGDEVIKEVAERIKANTRSSDIAARIGGDEFLIFMEAPADAEALVRRVFGRLMGKFREFDVSVSMGVVCTDQTRADYDTLLGFADAAMYSVKKDSKGRFAFYKKGMPLMHLQLLTAQDEEETK